MPVWTILFALVAPSIESFRIIKKNMQNHIVVFLKKSINKNDKLILSVLFVLVLLFYVLVSLFKVQLGADERAYLSLGLTYLDTGVYGSAKHHPMFALLLGLLTKLFGDPLWGIRALYAAAAAGMVFPLYYLNKQFFERRDSALISVLLIVLLPGQVVLPLYSGTQITYQFFAYSGLVIFVYSLSRNYFMGYFISGAIIGCAYLTRLDGLILFALLIILSMCLSFTKFNSPSYKHILVFACGGIVLALPWHVWLLQEGLLISTVVVGGWESEVWADGPAKMFVDGSISSSSQLGIVNILKSFFSSIASNVRLFSEHMGSLRLFPFFIWPLIGIGLFAFKKWDKLIWYSAPGAVTVSYLFFYVEARYLIALLPLLGLLATIGLLKVNRKINASKPYPIASFFVLIAITDITYLIFGHQTYAQ